MRHLLSESNQDNGSSKRINVGFDNNERAIANLCCSPPERALGYFLGGFLDRRFRSSHSLLQKVLTLNVLMQILDSLRLISV